MKRYHLKKMSDLLDALEIVSNNAKKKGHRSGYRCHQLAKELADQFEVFVPTLTQVITDKENKWLKRKLKTKNTFGLSKGEFEIYQVVKSKQYRKLVDIYQDKAHNLALNTTKQYVFFLKKKGFVQSIKCVGKNYKYYQAKEVKLSS